MLSTGTLEFHNLNVVAAWETMWLNPTHSEDWQNVGANASANAKLARRRMHQFDWRKGQVMPRIAMEMEWELDENEQAWKMMKMTEEAAGEKKNSRLA
jgi:hypothetical protein